jgi:hypothetical protein
MLPSGKSASHAQLFQFVVEKHQPMVAITRDYVSMRKSSIF